MHFQPLPIGLEPTPDLAVFVVRGVVLNQYGALPPVSPGQLFEEAEISRRIEHRILTIVESGAPQFDGAENLHVLTLSGHRNFRWATSPAPGSVKRRIESEAGFVGEDQRPVSRSGFFLRAG